ncbi:TPA: hypothetical protein DCZ15_04160 [Candidatus Falkowbacteria bacterium]|jgi:hypothetical protein|nr:MAG: hypothetical protein UV95_C0001G0338 [Candidatus Falkowbacteria bacterium GW2011_GWF2_43_32]HBA37034.1 hypothetical protein [Candidatus Falkowbacteria bacterium]
MKKISFLIILAVFTLSFAVIAPLQAEETDQSATTAVTATATANAASVDGLEKIPSPDQIKNFRVMKKIGNALYGVRREQSQTNSSSVNATSTKATSTNAGVNSTDKNLEKIAAPAFINLYEKIRKVGNALWGIKKETPRQPLTVTADISACVIAAIDVKDKALVEKVNTVAVDFGAAITARSVCQQAAVQSADDQKKNLDACVNTFRTESKRINTAAKAKQKEIWGAYRTGLKECAKNMIGTSSSSEAVAGELEIEDGGEAVVDSLMDSSTE